MGPIGIEGRGGVFLLTVGKTPVFQGIAEPAATTRLRGHVIDSHVVSLSNTLTTLASSTSPTSAVIVWSAIRFGA